VKLLDSLLADKSQHKKLVGNRFLTNSVPGSLVSVSFVPASLLPALAVPAIRVPLAPLFLSSSLSLSLPHLSASSSEPDAQFPLSLSAFLSLSLPPLSLSSSEADARFPQAPADTFLAPAANAAADELPEPVGVRKSGRVKSSEC
jgi:hypothetical protein